MRLVGDLDFEEGSTFQTNVQSFLSDAPPATVLDLSGVEYLDSSGLGMLLSLASDYREAGGRLVIVASRAVQTILSLTKLEGFFTLARDADDARRLVEQPESVRA
jgi:anti-sigma B factor antagonist